MSLYVISNIYTIYKYISWSSIVAFQSFSKVMALKPTYYTSVRSSSETLSSANSFFFFTTCRRKTGKMFVMPNDAMLFSSCVGQISLVIFCSCSYAIEVQLCNSFECILQIAQQRLKAVFRFVGPWLP